MRRGDEFSIMVGGNELMNSRLSASEEALAALACAKIKSRANARILIGGLGMGFTLRAALACCDAATKVDVAEIVPEVVAWAKGEMGAVFGQCLEDPRVDVIVADVLHVLQSSPASYDAILLDVDNGPGGLTRADNDALYSALGLKRAGEALRPGGVLAVWSSGPDVSFTRRLAKARFSVEEVPTRARGKKGARHMIWLAQKAAP